MEAMQSYPEARRVCATCPPFPCNSSETCPPPWGPVLQLSLLPGKLSQALVPGPLVRLPVRDPGPCAPPLYLPLLHVLLACDQA